MQHYIVCIVHLRHDKKLRLAEFVMISEVGTEWIHRRMVYLKRKANKSQSNPRVRVGQSGRVTVRKNFSLDRSGQTRQPGFKTLLMEPRVMGTWAG